MLIQYCRVVVRAEVKMSPLWTRYFNLPIQFPQTELNVSVDQIFHFYFLNISRGFVQIRNPQLEAVACKLEPKVEGRIMQLTPEVNIFIIIFFLVGGEYSIFLEYSPQMQPTLEVNIQYFFISNILSYWVDHNFLFYNFLLLFSWGMTNHCDWCEDVIARNDLKSFSDK